MENLIAGESKVKKLCVIKRDGKWYMPKTIPKERESLMPIFASITVLLLLTDYCLQLSGNFLIYLPQFLGFYSFMILSYIIVYTFLYRLVLFQIERKHLCSRYENDISKLFFAAFYFNKKTIAVIVLCMVYASGYTMYSLANGDEFWSLVKSMNCIPLISFWVLFFLHQLLGLNDFPINDSLLIAKDDGLDYGSGMAYSFFYGYLNYILSRTGDPSQTLKDMMQTYESKEQINFAMYKIFILIPKSLKCHEQVDHGSRIMEMRKSLLEKRITVAGVRDRIYKNSVYSVKSPGVQADNDDVPKKEWVCVEYATPLKTFKEVIENSTAHTEFYNRHKTDIILQFYLTLERILERTGMSSMCELVYYEDTMTNDGKTYYHDIGKILLSKIRELKKSERPHQE